MKTLEEDMSVRERAEEGLQPGEGLMRALTDSAQDAILMMDPEGRISYWNPSAERILGYTSDEALGQDLHDLLVPEPFLPAYHAAYPAFRQTGQGPAMGKTVELRARRKDGLEIAIQLSLSAIQMKDGWHAAGIIRDPTESLRAKSEIQHQAAIARFNPNPVLELSAAGEINYFNHATEAMAHALGLANAALLLPPDTAAMAGECLATGTPKLRVETRVGPRVISWSFFPVKVTNTVHGYGGDITERRQAEEALRLQSAALEAAANAIVITDRNGTIQSVNPAFTALTGYTAEEVLGKNPRLLKGGKQDEAFYRNLWRTISSGQVWSGQLTNRRKDGSLYEEEMTITPLRDGDGAIARYIGIKQDVTERKRAEEALRASHQIIEGIINAIPVGVFWKDKNLVYLGCNTVFARDAGFADPKDIIGKDDYQMGWRDQAEKYRGDDLQVIESGCPKLMIEEPQTTPEGNTLTLLSSKIPLLNAKGEISGVLGTYMDITERKRLETHLFQSQKMETVGKLAGGVAHEFNSIMTAILGQSELMLYDLPEGNALCKKAAEIHRAAERAAALTRQLLAYGRKQILRPDILDLNTVLAGMEDTLRHLAGDNVDLHIAPPPGPMLVKADAGQIEQVIVNVVMNAAEAMPRGGKLTLETAERHLDQEYVSQFADLKAGEYVMLAITDTGAGMSEALKARIFEPFFTTKDIGKGIGFGLATCHGIIKQSGGHINVYSEPGRGATFKIYLPKVEEENKPPAPPLKTPDLPHGIETILLVEDDPALREMAASLLGRLGYTVLSAGNGLEALNVTHQRATGHIDLLFTDVVMPHMSGKELADRMQALYPHTRILFTSAYTPNAIVQQGMLNKDAALLAKPFTPTALARRVRELLDQPAVPKPDPPRKTPALAQTTNTENTP
ncbi:MAG: PAS domain S-box protein [Verrucomicrobiota bacterium]